MAWEEEPIEVLGLTSRVCTVLRAAGVGTLGKLLRMKRLDLSYIPHLGPSAAQRIRQKQATFLQDPEGMVQRWKAEVAAREAAATITITPGTLLADLNLPKRTLSVLRMAKIKTVGQLCALTRAQLKELGGFGPFVLGQLEQAIMSLGFALAEGPEAAPAPRAKPGRKPRPDPPDETHPVKHRLGSFPGTRIGPIPPELADGPIELLGLSRRTHNALTAHGIHTLGDLGDRTLGGLLRFRNLGKNSAREVLNATASLRQQSEGGLSPDAPAAPPGSLDDLGLPSRSRRAIDLAGATTIPQLCALTPQAIRALHGVGKGTVAEIERVLARHGLTLAGQSPEATFAFPAAGQVLDSLEGYAGAASELLAACGGVMPLDELAAALSARYPTGRMGTLSFARLMLPRCKGIRSDGDLCVLESRWERFRQVKARVRQELIAAGHPLPVQTLIARVGPEDGASVWAYLRQNKRFRVAGEWCLLTAWLPRVKLVWSLAALDLLGRPAGAEDVARVLGEIAPHLGEVDVPRVVRRASAVAEVGPGVFGLRRWGAEARAAAAAQE
jgi:DNA-directed RNA polymerase alpha subunit